MAKQKNNIAKLSNSFSAGGGGGSFERRIQAVFLLSLLIDGFSPILNMPMERVAFQARQLGDAVDDMVVFSTSGAKLLCQMKHSLSVTEKDATFQEVMRAAWHDFCAKTFSKERDKIALFTGFIANDSIDALRQLQAEGYKGHLKAMQRKTWGGALREAKERMGMSWAAFDAHILAARSIVWPEFFGKG